MFLDLAPADRRLAFVEAARGFVGVPWRHQGRTRQGLDCVGLLVATARELHIDHGADFLAYGPRPDGRLHGILGRYLRQVPERVRSPWPGDVVELILDGWPCHVGIVGVLEERGGVRLSLIHALTSAGKVIEHRLLPSLVGCIRATFSFPELEPERECVAYDTERGAA